MRAIFICHGQSTGNAGIPCNDLALLELTELGWRQSREVAASWIERPYLMVTSALPSHPAHLHRHHRAVPGCAGGGVADPGVYLPPTQSLEWNPQLRTDALP